MSYRLGQDFASLRAHGTADIGSAYLLYPLRMSRTANVQVQLNIDRKWLDDQSDSTGARSRKRINVLALGMSGDRLDATLGGGITSWSLTYALGHLRADAGDAASSVSVDPEGGRYQKLFASVSHQQDLGPRLPGWQLAMQLSAQLSQRISAHGNAASRLDSSEKFSLGGLQGVRAYPQGEGSSDDGWTGTLELRRSVTPAWQLTAFLDAGEGWQEQPFAEGMVSRARQRLSGFGLGVSHTGAGGLFVNAALSWRMSGAPKADSDRSPRLWASMSQSF